jgi:hypothetical protein
MTFKKFVVLVLTVPVINLFTPGSVQIVLADVTCENSDYNCIYVDTVSGGRIVCTRSVCGSGSFGGRTYRLEGLYAFDGPNPNTVTTTTAAAATSTTTATTTTETTTTVSGGSSSSSTTTVSGGSSSSSTTTVSGGSSSSSTTTTTAAGATNPCLDPANPNYACGWAVLGTNNQVTSVIVCTFSVCGSGSFGGMRLVLQTQQQDGGNVAGWSGSTYDDKSATFLLPGGGTLKSGDKIEEAVFPTTTTTSTTVVSSSTTSLTTTVPSSNAASVAKDIAAPSGVVYQSVEKYVAAETETVMTAKSVKIKLPVIPVREVKYEVSFDPAGPKRKIVLEIGKIVDNQVIKDENKQGFKKLTFAADSKVKNSTIYIDQKILKNRNGLISVTLATNVAEYASVNIKVNAAKKYSSCKELNKDYPGGVVASSKWRDLKSSKQRVGYVAKPVLNIRTFYLNRKLDLDKDKVVCELNN